MMNATPNEEYLTVEQLAQRLGWEPKTVQNKMSGKDAIFKRGIHFSQAPGLPVMFKWSAVLALYNWTSESAPATRQPVTADDVGIPMARGYSMK
jgi:hypothetical protein